LKIPAKKQAAAWKNTSLGSNAAEKKKRIDDDLKTGKKTAKASENKKQ